jgi:hypothetical protein
LQHSVVLGGEFEELLDAGNIVDDGFSHFLFQELPWPSPGVGGRRELVGRVPVEKTRSRIASVPSGSLMSAA